MKLYREVLIESAEQLAALPKETIMRARTGALCKTGTIVGDPCVWEEGWMSFKDAIEHLAPLTAFAPIEAAEEILYNDTYASSEQLRRYVTDWERFTAGGTSRSH